VVRRWSVPSLSVRAPLDARSHTHRGPSLTHVSPLPSPLSPGVAGKRGPSPLSPLPEGRGGVGGGWRNEGTIESKRELVVAVEAGKYNNGKKRFESAR